MKVICPISGIALYKTPYLIGFDLADAHPIFRAKKKLILCPDMVHRFVKAEQFEEKKLIFLAVLNATDLIEFRRPAEPSLQLVESQFYKLMHTAGWLSFAEYTYKSVVAFPQYIVNEENKDLTSLPAWINACEDIKDQVIKKDINRDRAASLSQREADFRKEIGDATLLHRAFTPTLARWAVDFAGLKKNDDRYNRWIKILCSPLSDAWVYSMEELREIENFLEEELPYDHPQVLSIMAQIRLLIAECKKGFTEFAVFKDDDDIGDSYTILEDGEQRLSKHLEDVPINEPQVKDFANRAAYLVAMAKYKLANRSTQPAKPQTSGNVLTEDSV